ncbi:hypothetical protein EXIGLDRAFT_782260 [Exidia glandulosa HHB12029]|uniref:Uncharacterized protein n=1 Tax=Exidia glandulosa HHB12029 TaxID=1314781 RepID=A0A165AWP1_EXIGL|nr:hypothetical protein EXIGLDRAFT_782260 [Exidia glandulosa HHB12029]
MERLARGVKDGPPVPFTPSRPASLSSQKAKRTGPNSSQPRAPAAQPTLSTLHEQAQSLPSSSIGYQWDDNALITLSSPTRATSSSSIDNDLYQSVKNSFMEHVLPQLNAVELQVLIERACEIAADKAEHDIVTSHEEGSSVQDDNQPPPSPVSTPASPSSSRTPSPEPAPEPVPSIVGTSLKHWAPDSAYDPTDLIWTEGVETALVLTRWAYALRGAPPPDVPLNRVHPDYWLKTDLRQAAREDILNLIQDLGRLCEYLTEDIVHVMAGAPEITPASAGASVHIEDIKIWTNSSRYVDAAPARKKLVLVDMFRHLLAANHAAYWPQRKKHLMTRHDTKYPSTRLVRDAVEPWRFVGLPIVSILADHAPQYLEAEQRQSLDRVQERMEWRVKHKNEPPPFTRLRNIFRASTLDDDDRSSIMRMLYSCSPQHHPGYDWFYLFMDGYHLPADLALRLFSAAIKDCVEVQWPF